MEKNTISEMQRHSAVEFNSTIEESEKRQNWNVVLHYQGEGDGPWLVDLAHKVRLDLQDSKIEDVQPFKLSVPKTPGASLYADTTLINRMNGTQASIYFLGNTTPEPELEPFYTDISETSVFLALFGPNVFAIAEKLSSLDFFAPDKEPPFLYQGPFCHVPCQIVTLERNSDGSGIILLSCSRGYAESMVEAILDSGEEFGLRPAGEKRFSARLEELSL